MYLTVREEEDEEEEGRINRSIAFRKRVHLNTIHEAQTGSVENIRLKTATLQTDSFKILVTPLYTSRQLLSLSPSLSVSVIPLTF